MHVLYYVSMLQCWQLVWILVRTNHHCLGVGRHMLCMRSKLGHFTRYTSKYLSNYTQHYTKTCKNKS
jgi:hypothetical protein